MNIGKSVELEWLETNGRGGYASSTILGCHTRKYHGLLVSNQYAPAGKFVLLSKYEDALVCQGDEHVLSVHRYAPRIFYPRGHRYQTEFRLECFPTFVYEIGQTTVVKEIGMIHGEDTVLVRYTARRNGEGAALRLRPLLACRGFHHLAQENLFLRPRTFPVHKGFKIAPYDGIPQLYFQVSGPFEFFPSPTWYRNFEYFREQERGYEANEDLFSPGMFELPLLEGQEIIVSASTREIDGDLRELWNTEAKRRAELAERCPKEPMHRRLCLSAEQFLVRELDRSAAIIAGYPWFLSWGRDSMISLPGLVLRNPAVDESVYLEVMRTFAAAEQEGLIPNFLSPDPKEHAYNSVDAALWFAWAAQMWERHTRQDLPEDLRAVLLRIFERYRDGTRMGIRMLENGLLTCGSEHHQLTWMDANVGGKPVTPRWGCPVEINALWYNLLEMLADMGERYGWSVGRQAAQLAARAKKSFNDEFWLAGAEHLADVVRDDYRDEALRPNQIFAVSLPFSPLEPERQRSVLDAVRATLMTPYGLRTLSPADPAYCPRYEGSQDARDAAYHNGTVWPWLLGAYGEALLKVVLHKEEAIREVEHVLEHLAGHMKETGLGTISEVFDGDPPPLGKGCISQAWSVAETLRLIGLLKEIKGKASTAGRK
ncbi:MAG: glycogen debranching enzyme N-terminal domain-containing protein [Myxococcota bacterium]|nr:glycogen debranching enzyme N-terminal domain-containing protein [Myxococcota bacterium]